MRWSSQYGWSEVRHVGVLRLSSTVSRRQFRFGKPTVVKSNGRQEPIKRVFRNVGVANAKHSDPRHSIIESSSSGRISDSGQSQASMKRKQVSVVTHTHSFPSGLPQPFGGLPERLSFSLSVNFSRNVNPSIQREIDLRRSVVGRRESPAN